VAPVVLAGDLEGGIRRRLLGKGGPQVRVQVPGGELEQQLPGVHPLPGVHRPGGDTAGHFEGNGDLVAGADRAGEAEGGPGVAPYLLRPYPGWGVAGWRGVITPGAGGEGEGEAEQGEAGGCYFHGGQWRWFPAIIERIRLLIRAPGAKNPPKARRVSRPSPGPGQGCRHPRRGGGTPVSGWPPGG